MLTKKETIKLVIKLIILLAITIFLRLNIYWAFTNNGSAGPILIGW